MSYDHSLTNFSADGRIPQLEYANEAVKRGLCAVAVRGRECVILGAEKKSVTILQEPRTIRKIYQIDNTTCMVQSGLQADARIMANIVRARTQSYSLDYDDVAPVDVVANQVASICKFYTQKGGARPMGIAALIGGFDSHKRPRLYTTDPTGSCTEWKANSVGKNAKQVLEFLEKNYKEEMSIEEALKLSCKSMLDVVESGSKNIELGVITLKEFRMLTDEEVEKLVQNVNK